jgi:predicted acetyltransferase
MRAWAAEEPGRMLLKLPEIRTSGNEPIGWVMLRNEMPVALATLELDGASSGHIDILVKPSERRRGYGTKLLERVLQEHHIKTLHIVRASAELDNTAAQKVLTNAGFSRVGYAADGRIEFEKH